MSGLNTMQVEELQLQKERRDREDVTARIKSIDSLTESLACEIKELNQKFGIQKQAAQPKTTITPGPELDRAVAEAADPCCSVRECVSSVCIDIPPSQVGDTDPGVPAVWNWKGKRNWRTLPKFSTDLNVAFKAAEKVDLFPADGMRFLRKEVDETWTIEEIYTITPYEVCIVGKASTPALAICAAILEMRPSQD